ncbi:MAG: hypothetical protein JNL08_12430 [Planctomycetes bacterium]|nr:hypothetical protein [Planctomycetota bacterium]
MSSYDPFAYGQVKMGDDAKATSAAPSNQPDDILFANSGQLPADSSWGLLEEDMGSLLPGGTGGGSMSTTQFGDDVLGAAPAPAAAPVKARPAAAPRRDVATAGRPTTTPARPAVADVARVATTANATAVAPAKPATAPVGTAPVRTRRPGGGAMAAWGAPLLVATIGGGAAAWLYTAQQNQVLGGIVVGLTLVGTTFARVFFRR